MGIPIAWILPVDPACTSRTIQTVHITGTDATTARMSLDSGTNVAVLNRNKVAPDWIPNMGVERDQVIGKEHQYLRLLEARDIQVGSVAGSGCFRDSSQRGRAGIEFRG
jgi:hypothetical protein